MALLESELDIVSVKTLFEKELRLPEYQRPYRWSVESVDRLFDDVRNAMNGSEESEYRLGSVVLCKNDGVYDVVDGQQRITTLALLLQVLCGADDSDLDRVKKLEYTANSSEVLGRNMAQIRGRVVELSGAEKDESAEPQSKKERFARYIKENCTFVIIVTDDQREAFQFFDSQNHRGKELAPHDLLKAFHLREMDAEEEMKSAIVQKWESCDEQKLRELFSFHLYPLTRWYKGKDGLDYSTAKIKQFKGVSTSKDPIYAYVLYHKAARNGQMHQFQLTQPILPGTDFFHYVLHYMELLDGVNKIIEKYAPMGTGVIPESGNGNIYVKRLLQNMLMFYADRFGIEAIDEIAFGKMFSYCYLLRLNMHAVQQKTINRYALGLHEKFPNSENLFEKINEMISPEEIRSVVIDKSEVQVAQPQTIAEGGKYRKLYERMKKYCGWGD